MCKRGAGWLGPYLQHREACLPRQAQFLLLRGVSVETMVVQPVSQDLHRLLGQVSAATPLARAARQVQGEAAAPVILTRVTVRHHCELGLLDALLFQDWEDTRVSVRH